MSWFRVKRTRMTKVAGGTLADISGLFIWFGNRYFFISFATGSNK